MLDICEWETIFHRKKCILLFYININPPWHKGELQWYD